VNHADHTSSGTYTETFSITAPSSAGTYDVAFIAYKDDGCSQNPSGTYTLTGGIIVVLPTPTPAPTSTMAPGVTLNTIAEIRYVSFVLMIDADTANDPQAVTVQSQVQLRNLKDNL
jgi:hypothetical protein